MILWFCARAAKQAEAALEEIRQWVAENGLRLSPAKTHVGDCRQPGEGFEFLGYRFEAGRRRVRKKSLDRFKDKIRAKTGRTRGDSLQRIVTDLNRTLRGWFEYFKHADPSPSWTWMGSSADDCVRCCSSRPSDPGWAEPTERPSPLAQCLLRASRAARPVRGLARGETLPMRKPPTGEPYAGKPHVRFGGRGGANPSRPLSK